jgi:hypothetical protein
VLRFLAKCPDEAPSPETAGLAVLSDSPDLQRSLRFDLSEVNTALVEGRWKSATVLGGAVVEALLLWALDRDEYRESCPPGHQEQEAPSRDQRPLHVVARHPTEGRLAR